MGFKSFADRITVEFVPGITAVVGPNGSGKSNITDAIRWVLGEQSAKSLRGGKMEDIIFAGSESRKPLNFAEVTLTLDNEDGALPIEYNEVSVTRRVYRSGESEFYINKQSCRLKDIVDLFMDSGLGREAFSIISQGKVEEILNSKPEERRTIFEEAAGVLKYKTRKRKAESKLTETKENLNRVNDILHELEAQIEPLQIQASIAKDYLEKKSELENIEVALTVHEIDQLHGEWEKLKSELETHADQEMKGAAEIQVNEAELEENRDKLAALDESISDLQAVLLSVSEELEKLEGRREVLKERNRNAVHNKSQMKNSIAEAEERISQLQQQAADTETEYRRKQQEARQARQELEAKKQQLSLLDGSIEDTIESLKSDYIESLNDQASAKNEMQYVEQQLSQQEMRASRLNGENEKHILQRQSAAEEVESISKDLGRLKNEIDQQISRFRESQQKLDKMKSQYEKQQSQLFQAYQFVQKTRSRKESLEEMEEDFSGFYHGVREVLKARGSELEGIEGAIAELIQVPKQYELAMETALGGAVQSLVVQTEEHGRKAIQFLKKNQYGRATFLPLNVMKAKQLLPDQLAAARQDDSFVGIASDLVGFNVRYTPAVKNVLGNIIVAKDLQGANQLARKLKYRVRVVTLDGDVVNPGGSMTGGTVKHKSNSLLGRKAELEELKQKLAVMEEKTDHLEQDVKRLKENIAAEEILLGGIRESGEELRLQQAEAEARLRQAEMNKKNVNDRLVLYDLEMNELESEKKVLQERKELLEERMEKSTLEIHRINSEIEQLTTRRNEERSSRETLAQEISALTARLAVATEQLAASTTELDRLRTEIQEAEARKKRWTEELDWLKSEMSGHHTSEEELAEDARKKLAEKEETARLIAVRREERLKLQDRASDMEAGLKEQKRRHQSLVGILKDTEVKINRLDVELDNRLNRLREEYSLSYEGAKESYKLGLPEEEARKKVKLIKMEISELGTVNLGAIEEYERVHERYEFLSEQQADLLQAKDTLFHIMDEMDEEMKKRFSHSFHAIQKEFEGVFRALFGGGTAELKLTDPEDLLLTGVDIVAQPPGKKLQNLSLMSGGERSLTAIALLFSILKVRPVPFCILDEVEAALDEANVHRFSSYLKVFSTETQFIVITHRQGTMQGADVLYGVTMQESGVSKLVSVKLEDSRVLV